MVEIDLKDNRLNRKFQELSLKNECALSCYIVAGYPTESGTEEIASTLVEAGVDIIEIGIPFSDPIADGPTIQEASNIALLNGITPEKCFKICSNIRRKFPDLPLVVMTYSNIVFRPGLENFIIRSKKCGIDGFILPDMTVEESRTYVNKASALGLATIFLVSPNTDKNRLDQILNMSSGFLYVVSVFGITGVREAFEEYTLETIRLIKRVTKGKIPVAVGFGISKPHHIMSMVEAGADAVIVGSAIIDKIKKYSSNKKTMLIQLRSFIKEMKTVCNKKEVNKNKSSKDIHFSNSELRNDTS